ncbi:MAG: hypothetical protein RI935_35 [Candidatus Parcubacteria bacterium]|jgi:hypothetical protein
MRKFPVLRAVLCALLLFFNWGLTSAQNSNTPYFSAVPPAPYFSTGIIAPKTSARRMWSVPGIYCDTSRADQVFELVSVSARNKERLSMKNINNCLQRLEEVSYTEIDRYPMPSMVRASAGNLHCSFVPSFEGPGMITLRYALDDKVSQADIDQCLSDLDAKQKSLADESQRQFTPRPCATCQHNKL